MPSLLRSAPVSSRALPHSSHGLSRTPGFEITQHLATGNQFELYRARAAKCGSLAADYVLKTIRPEIADRALALAILQREAQIAMQVAHPNLISVFACQLGEHAGDAAYLVLPYLPGRTLQRLSEQQAQVPVPRALWFLRQATEALAALHERGWLHGDVKLTNMIVSDQGHVTLIDLGLARKLGTSECRTENWLAGDANYLPPEAFIPGFELTSAADVYALGLSLLHLLQGRAKEMSGPLLNNLQAATELRAKRPDVSRELATLIANMTATEPLRRPLVSELLSRLSRLEIESLMQW